MVGSGVLKVAAKFAGRINVLVARTLVDMGRKEVSLRLLNSTAKFQTVHKDTIMAWCEPMIEVWDTRYELLTVASCQKPDGYQARNASAEVPDVLNWSSKHLGNDQRGEVAILLKQFADMFSASDDDLGKAGIGRHRIDRGGAQPIRFDNGPNECLYIRGWKQRLKFRKCSKEE